MGNLIDHSRGELERLGKDPDVIDGYLNVIEAFGEMAKTESVESAGPLIYALLQNRNLTPLTDDPDEWIFIKKGTWQSTRNADACSPDGGKSFFLISEKESKRKAQVYMTEKTGKSSRG